jgi:tRNA 2-thiouridine synthesizing protein A
MGVFMTPQSPRARRRSSRFPYRVITIMWVVARVLDLRGLRCPLVLVRTRQALAGVPAGEELVVLATDPEAPIDLAALAADNGLAFAQERDGAEWRLVLGGGGRVV